MNEFMKAAAGGLHHAYIVEGDHAAAFAALAAFFEAELGFSARGNPDFWHADFDSFGVDDARAVKERASLRPVTGERKVIVVKTHFMTHEAQNALLKVFEEPTAGTHIFLIMPSVETLLPTLVSRAFVIRPGKETGSDTLQLAEKFLASDQAGRTAIVKKILDEYSDTKDKSKAVALVAALEDAARKKIDLARATEEQIFALSEIERARRYLHDRSPSVKVLLEHLSVIVPAV